MIDNSPISYPEDISVRSEVLRIAITDNKQFKAIYELPPVREIMAIQKLSLDKVSVQETIDTFYETNREDYYEEFLQLSKEVNRFGDSATYLNRLSLLLERSGKLKEASDYLQKAVEKSNSSYLRSRLAVAQARNELTEEAVYNLEALAREGDLYAILNLALARLYRKDMKAAISAADEAVKKDSVAYEPRILRGSLFLITGQAERALRDFRSALEDRPDSYIAYANMAVAYLILGNINKAIQVARQSYYLNPTDRNVVAMLCDLYNHTNQHDEIIPVLKNYLEYDRKETDLWDRLAKAYYRLKNYSLSMETLRHEASVEDTFGVWNNMALVAAARGDHSKANQLFSHSWSMCSIDRMPEILVYNFFRSLARTGEWKSILEKSTPIIPKYLSGDSAASLQATEIVLNHILALMGSGRESEAIAVAEEYLKAHTEDSFTLLNMLTFLLYHYSLRDKNREKALNYAERAKSVIRRWPILRGKARRRAINNLAYAYLEFDQLEEAIDSFECVKGELDKDVFLLATYGYLQIKKGNIESGVRLYKKAVGLCSSHKLAQQITQKLHLELARSYASAGITKKAKNEYLKVIKTKNGNEFFVNEAVKELDRLGIA